MQKGSTEENLSSMNEEGNSSLYRGRGQSMNDGGTVAKEKPDNKEVTYKLITNDNTRKSMKTLMDLKNIFSKQLPKMPKDYIVKLVMDRNHESIVIVREDGKIIGGITFRAFKEEKFAEVAFLAISFQEQIRGYGSTLMNKLKQELQKREIWYMITFADNQALGYFRKQGFSDDCHEHAEKWKGFFKEYEGGTLMQCKIYPKIDYSRIREIIKLQKKAIISKIESISLSETIYDGKQLAQLAQKYQRLNSDGEIQTFKIDPTLIPGLVESGWTWNDHEELRKTRQISFHAQCFEIIQAMKKHPSAWPFRVPVSQEQIPEYYQIIQNPIDLKMIQYKIACGDYTSKEGFCEDVIRMFGNCRKFNQKETVYYKCATDLQEFIKPHLESLKEGVVPEEKKKNKRKGVQG